MHRSRAALSSKRKRYYPGWPTKKQGSALRKQYIWHTRNITPFRGSPYASHSHIATFQPVRLYFDHVGPRDEEAFLQKLSEVHKFLPGHRFARIGDILEELEASGRSVSTCSMELLASFVSEMVSLQRKGELAGCSVDVEEQFQRVLGELTATFSRRHAEEKQLLASGGIPAELLPIQHSTRPGYAPPGLPADHSELAV
eukprot:RCo049075